MNGDRKLVWAIIISVTLHIAIVFMGNKYAPWKIERSNKNGTIVIQLNSAIVKPETVEKKPLYQAVRKIRAQKETTPPAKRKEPVVKEKPLERQTRPIEENKQPGKNLTKETTASAPLSAPSHFLENGKNIYSEELRKIIEQNQRYPVMALRKKLHGTVMVGFALNRSGRLLECHVVESCGHKLLDRAALRAVKTVNSFPPFPEEFKEPQANFTIPVTFIFRK